MAACFICVDTDGEYLGVFESRSLAEASWRMSYGRRYEVLFDKGDVLTETAGFGRVTIGRILHEEIRTKPDHL